MGKFKKGFTLIELIIVIVICGILGSIIFGGKSQDVLQNFNNNKVIAGYVTDYKYVPEVCSEYSCEGEHYVIYVKGYDANCEDAVNNVKMSNKIFDIVLNNNDSFYGLKTHYKKCKFK